ncbi:SRPBCC family protein [Leucobacter sp. CSA2]|uniref:SRPBCC family protein n=1 Tax=Leucobacter edaphi TaxID=2796472 RepID=A0A934UYS1_9MICO|nr:SRPBCC domain-containing protein [Leucobacter edaphi]MBK0422747.1 SRPBCC family protein [Leucobacter edaphi]
MSNFTSAAAASHTLSVTAMEEASREGERRAGIEHLFLALVLDSGDAGTALRSLGITLDAAREAVAAQHDSQLAELGIRAETPGPNRIVFHETDGYEWTEPAQDVFKSASSGSKWGTSDQVLRELIVEPSGFIEFLLARLGVSADAVLGRLDQLREASATQLPAAAHRLTRTSTAFVPASPAEVWGLLSHPERMPEWEPNTGLVEDLPEKARPGAEWIAHARLSRPDGKPLKVREDRRWSRVELVDLAPESLIEWRFTWPESPNSNTMRLRIGLEPAAGGTQLELTVQWERSPHAKAPKLRVLRGLARPLMRYAMWLQLMQLGGSIGRVFR